MLHLTNFSCRQVARSLTTGSVMLAKAVEFAICADGVNMSCERGLGLLFILCLPPWCGTALTVMQVGYKLTWALELSRYNEVP